MDLWEAEKWFSKEPDFYVFYDQSPASPTFSDYEEGWTFDSSMEEDYALIPQAPYLEVICRLEMKLIFIRIQVTQQFIPFFPAKVVTTTILDLTWSFLWTGAPREIPWDCIYTSSLVRPVLRRCVAPASFHGRPMLHPDHCCSGARKPSWRSLTSANSCQPN